MNQKPKRHVRIVKPVRFHPALLAQVTAQLSKHPKLTFTNYLETLILSDQKKGFKTIKKKMSAKSLF